MDIRAQLVANSVRPKPEVPRFGFTSAPLVQKIFSNIEKNDIYETLFKDVAGFNAPRVITARSPKEGWDTFRSEILNTGVTAVGTFALAPLMNKGVSHMMGLSQAERAAVQSEAKFVELAAKATPEKLARLKLGRMGTALGFMFPFAALFYANPFFRNWWTLKKEKTTNFDALIGLDNGQLQKPTEDLKTQLKRQMGMVLKTVGIGLGLGALSVLGVRSLINTPGKYAGLRKIVLDRFEHWSLTGEKLNQVRSGMATLLFWSAPAYVGWVHAARTHSERREWWVKFANSTVWFFGTPWLTSKLVKPFNALVSKYQLNLPAASFVKENAFTGAPSYKYLDETLQPLLANKEVYQQLRKAKTFNYLFGLGFSIVMLGVTPQLFNRYFTKKRYEERKKQLESQHLTTHPASAKPPSKLTDWMMPPASVASGWNPWTLPTRETWGSYPYQQQAANFTPWTGWPVPQYYNGY